MHWGGPARIGLGKWCFDKILNVESMPMMWQKVIAAQSPQHQNLTAQPRSLSQIRSQLTHLSSSLS